MRTKLVTLVTLAAAIPWLAACADDGPSSPGSSSSSSASTSSASPSGPSPAGPSPTGSSTATTSTTSTTPTPTGTSVDIMIKKGKVTPNGDRVEVEVGEPVTLRIDADQAGEIHVHATPEQEIEYARGTSTKKLRITRPGIVDVEDHHLEQVIVQLEVR